MRKKSITNSERIRVYVEGKRAFEEQTPYSDNPYIASKDLAGLWQHGWDMAQGKSKGKKSPLDERDLTIQLGGKL
jgi:hypothetical protein